MEQRFEIRWLKRTLPLQPESVVLEIGCGRGAGASLILKEFQPAAIHAMDLDWKMIRLGKRFLSSREKNSIFMYVGDVLHLPYGDGSLDAVFDFGVLHHVPDWRSAVSEICRILKPGGTFYVEELYPTLYQNFITRHILLHPTEDRFGSRDFQAALAVAGLNRVDSLEVKGVGLLAVLVKEA
jgi:ubiquinone/menaquinone biosynthesis C-methylase UbiE